MIGLAFMIGLFIGMMLGATLCRRVLLFTEAPVEHVATNP
jgi:hypothetical protein